MQQRVRGTFTGTLNQATLNIVIFLVLQQGTSLSPNREYELVGYTTTDFDINNSTSFVLTDGPVTLVNQVDDQTLLQYDNNTSFEVLGILPCSGNTYVVRLRFTP